MTWNEFVIVLAVFTIGVVLVWAVFQYMGVARRRREGGPVSPTEASRHMAEAVPPQEIDRPADRPEPRR
jgi:hypothetical protein